MHSPLGFYILVILLLAAKNLTLRRALLSSQGVCGTIESGVMDLGDILLVAFICVGILIRGLAGYGFTLQALVQCPWREMVFVWVIGFGWGRFARLYLFRTRARALVRAGVINPAGSFQMLGRLPLGRVLLLGVPVVACGTLMEELLFRGIIIDLMARGEAITCGHLVASATLFGGVHFLPMWLAHRRYNGVPLFLVAHAFFLPAVLGFIFSSLNMLSGSLWPGWILHWAQNYGSLVWNRIDDLWGRTSRESTTPY